MKNNAAKNTTVSRNLLVSKFCAFPQNFHTWKLGEITYLITALEPFQFLQWQKMLVLRKPDVFLPCWKISSPSKVQFYTQIVVNWWNFWEPTRKDIYGESRNLLLHANSFWEFLISVLFTYFSRGCMTFSEILIIER